MVRLLLLLTLCPFVFGCGNDNPLGRKAVSGAITLNGSALELGSIQFAPRQSGVSSGAEVKDGQYSIDETKGLTPGTYVVRVYSTDEESEAVEPELPGPGIKVQPDLIPAAYNRKSDIELIVEETDDEVVFDLEIKSKE